MQFFALEIEQPERARLRVEVFGDGGQRLLEGRFEVLLFLEAAGHLGEKRKCAFDFARCDGRCGALRKRLLFVRGVDHSPLPRIRRTQKADQCADALSLHSSQTAISGVRPPSRPLSFHQLS